MSKRTWFFFLGLLCLAVVIPDIAHAAGAGGGGNLPWDTPLQNLRQDLTGPVAFTLSLLAFFCAGVALVFGGEMSHFTRGMVISVMVCAMLTGIVNVASALGIAGAVVASNADDWMVLTAAVVF